MLSINKFSRSSRTSIVFSFCKRFQSTGPCQKDAGLLRHDYKEAVRAARKDYAAEAESAMKHSEEASARLKDTVQRHRAAVKQKNERVDIRVPGIAPDTYPLPDPDAELHNQMKQDNIYKKEYNSKKALVKQLAKIYFADSKKYVVDMNGLENLINHAFNNPNDVFVSLPTKDESDSSSIFLNGSDSNTNEDIMNHAAETVMDQLFSRKLSSTTANEDNQNFR
ncbi:mitochondrial ribosomal protein subunit S26 [Schizosaccharomyces osmophilus]|uniref:Mitochondrial ribosomal protein subunit S26 n=1 Tax=Schizosaccharomyces osmophilus TaxID=2545709 RepID=A0AAF0AVB7_9SCHI|nr:mitochondrial ribosomal protein subunit S26 [Schizosaccharomyces osmophilus]WBW71825.1 mitochondrial ribosomal protein subunit S26 [Schizosaccharomyces osmophilus]